MSANQYNVKQIWILSVNISIASYIFLYTLGVFNTCTSNVAASLDWGDNTSTYINVFSTIIPVGQTIGCIVTPWFLDKLGRRKTIITQDILFIAGSIILVMPHTVTFGIGRFFTGFTSGVMATIGPVFINEVSPVEMIGKVGPLVVISNALGLLCSYSFGLFLPIENFSEDPNNYLWLFLFLFPAALCCYQLVYFLFFMKHDTPQFYLSKNMINEANQALRLTHNISGIGSGLRRVNSDIRGKTGISGIKLSLFGMIKEAKYKKMFRVSIGLAILSQLCGSTAIFFYSTTIFMKLGGGLFMARVVTVIMGLVNLISSTLSIVLIPHFGRKTLLISAEALVCIDMLLLGIFSQYADVGEIAIAILLIAFFVPFGYGLAAVFWMYLSEVLNDQIFTFSCIIIFLVSTSVSLVFPIAVESVGIGNSFLFFSVSMAIGILYVLFDCIESQGKTKDQILYEMRVLDASIAPENNPEESSSLQEEVECEVDENNEIKKVGQENELDKTNMSPEKYNEGKEFNPEELNNNSFSTSLNYSTTNK
ncbi:hypothetical protein SteCoe_2249 [Stentor coeruleus]|uniref:Major facilitator superfamily (MFS) profile domain-containing protein n=1 Tax=Stentor coeruleus TaxID=5963 RepID=A0A1R2D054_9CILI|nr:hypothetical protein SteCoe_2249 [Stentor coeruleus]